jgi:hypothetical protein
MEADMQRMAAEEAELAADDVMPVPSLTPADNAVSRPVDPSRSQWRYQTSPEGPGGIVKQDEQGWLEVRSGRPDIRFQEVTRSDEFVELHDPGRRLNVRLYDDRMEWSRDGQAWSRGQDGKWDADQGVSVESPPAEEPPSSP